MLSSLGIHEDLGIEEVNSDIESNPKILVSSYAEDEEEVFYRIKKIESIKNAITINQKFIFVNELFKGDTSQYNSFIDHQFINLLN